ncbi:hypothetical protein Ctob_014315, partial [Chrysochromulina tobinii]
MARHEFWILVEARCPSAPALTGVGREHKDGVNSYWWRYSAPVRRGVYAAMAPWVPPLDPALLPQS